MCGICGFRSDSTVNKRAMLDSIAHRGPDGEGEYSKRDIWLGHRRLSIIDIDGGSQPMFSDDGRYGVVFNGEIYNYRELRADLRKSGCCFRTNSDTEVLLAMYQAYGTDMLQHLNGMFAFVIHDNKRDILFGARDRLGLKPFYYSSNQHGFFFASEIKSLLASGKVDSEHDPAGLVLYLARRYIPGERTAYGAVKKMRPGQYFIAKGPHDVSFHTYWDLPGEGETLTDEAIEERFGPLLRSAVDYRLISDVPLGVFLSGGVDSSAIAASMAQSNHYPLKTFTVGFSDEDADVIESRRTSTHFGCEQSVESVSLEDFDLYPKLMHHMDGPYGDPILLPLYVLCRSAAKKVKVVLSGDGADEAQLGYIHHVTLEKLGRMADKLPSFLFPLAGSVLGMAPVRMLDMFFNYPESMGRDGRARLKVLLGHANSPGRAYQAFTNMFSIEDLEKLAGPDLKLGVEEARDDFFEPEAREINNSADPLRAIYLRDMRHWLPDNILCKFDKMTMAASIEGRAPFLDHRLVEFLASLPSTAMIRNGQGKFVLNNYFEKSITIPGRDVRNKRAFYFPMRGGFRDRLNGLVQEYLREGDIAGRMLDARALDSEIKASSGAPLLGSKRLFAMAALGMWMRGKAA